MIYKISLEYEAELDFEDAYIFYLLISKDLAKNFGREINSAFSFISENPEIAFQRFIGLERFNIKQFPFSIYYLKNYDTKIVKVVGILHFKRDIDRIMSKRKSY